MSKASLALVFSHSLHFGRKSSWVKWVRDAEHEDDALCLTIEDPIVIAPKPTYQKE